VRRSQVPETWSPDFAAILRDSTCDTWDGNHVGILDVVSREISWAVSAVLRGMEGMGLREVSLAPAFARWNS
jgi:hypothetical protein